MSGEAAGAAFVTGGSGFIGGALIERLVAEGRPVRALARSEDSAAKVEGLGAVPVRGDLGDAASMAAGAAGCEVAFHLAAQLGEWGRWEDFERGNVEGTRNALAACAEAGVRRFVHCGTEAALMAGEPLVHIDETAPLRPGSRAPYPATKAQAEQAVRGASREGLRDRRRPAPVRLGQGRHDAAAGDGEDGRGGPVGLGRRRPQRHRYRPRRQRRRGHGARR